MRVRSAWQAILPVAAAICFACSSDVTPDGPDAGPADAGETPDLCTESAPCDLVIGERASDYLYPVGDVDPWGFDVVSAGQVVNLVVENDADFSPVRLEVALFGPDGVALENRRFQGNGKQRVELQLVAPAPGRYRLEVRDVGGDGADRRNPYFITVSLLSETDDNEPNDAPERAVLLQDGASASGTIGFQGDEDWFAFEVGRQELVQVEVSAPGESPVTLEWALFDPSAETPIAESTEPAGDAAWPVENRAVGGAAGRYLLRVQDDPADGQDADLDRVYLVTMRRVPEPDPQEQLARNDIAPNATPISSGDSVTGYIASTSDVDVYAIEVTQAPQLVVVEASMDGASPVDLAFTVLAPDGRTLICDERDGDLCAAFRFARDGADGPVRLRTAHVAEATGTYYVRVSDQQDNEFDTQQPYTLQVRLPAEPDATEDYALGGRSAAIPVTPTSTIGRTFEFPWVEGHISHAGDEDWYRFDVPGPESPDPQQNGDWLVHLELEMPAPTPVELQAFFFGPEGSDRERYRGYGKRCRDPAPDDPMNCQFPEADNGIDLSTGETAATVGQDGEDCFVIFREVTGAGPHYFRITDLDRDDFDLTANGRYRLRLTFTAGCPAQSVCAGRFLENGNDLCGRP